MCKSFQGLWGWRLVISDCWLLNAARAAQPLELNDDDENDDYDENDDDDDDDVDDDDDDDVDDDDDDDDDGDDDDADDDSTLLVITMVEGFYVDAPAAAHGLRVGRIKFPGHAQGDKWC